MCISLIYCVAEWQDELRYSNTAVTATHVVHSYALTKVNKLMNNNDKKQ